MVMQAYRANIEVNIKFKREANLTAEAKKALFNKISEQLKGTDSGANIKLDNSIEGIAVVTGEKLIWAVTASKESADFFVNK